MVSYVAPNNSVNIFMSVRYRVTGASGLNLAVQIRGVNMYYHRPS